MVIRSFFNEKKFITYTVLISFIIMNMTHAWASSTHYPNTIGDPEGCPTVRLSDVTKEQGSEEFNTGAFSITIPVKQVDELTDEPKDTSRTDEMTPRIAESQQYPTPSDQNYINRLLNNGLLFSKMAISLTVSTLASIALANLAQKLGEEYNNDMLAGSLYCAGLTANIILYCWNQMNLTKDDFTFQHYDTTLKNIGMYGATFAKQIITFVASAGLAWIGYTQYVDTNITTAYFVSVCGLIAQILIYSKSTSNLVKGISHKLDIIRLPYTEQTRVKCLQATNDSISISPPHEIEHYYEEINQYKNEKYKEKVSTLIALFHSNVDERFYIKELVGLVSGFGLSGVLGGMYLFEVGKPIYKSLFSTLLPHLSNTRITQLSLAGSSMLALGATPLQVYSTYNVFRLYTEVLYKLYDIQYSNKNKKEYQIVHQNPSQEPDTFILKVRKYICKGEKYAKEAFIILFSLGIAATRVALCMEYVQNKELLPILNVGVAFSFFSIYYWTMSSLIDGFTKVGKKRNELSKIITNEINQIISKNELPKSKRMHEVI